MYDELPQSIKDLEKNSTCGCYKDRRYVVKINAYLKFRLNKARLRTYVWPNKEFTDSYIQRYWLWMQSVLRLWNNGSSKKANLWTIPINLSRSSTRSLSIYAMNGELETTMVHSLKLKVHFLFTRTFFTWELNFLNYVLSCVNYRNNSDCLIDGKFFPE